MTEPGMPLKRQPRDTPGRAPHGSLAKLWRELQVGHCSLLANGTACCAVMIVQPGNGAA